MTRNFLLAATILICMPVIAFAQSNRGSTAVAAPCCGQVATAVSETREVQMQETQRNLRSILLKRSSDKQLRAGDYLIMEGPEGIEFRALVSTQGIVDCWYFADSEGIPVAFINTNGNQSGGGNNCFIKYGKDLTVCINQQTNGWAPPSQYPICIDWAWTSLLNCLRSANNGQVMR